VVSSPASSTEVRTITMTRKTIKRSKLMRLAFCNSKDLPKIVEIDGVLKQWVGIGWVDCGKPSGTETLVVD